MVSFSPEEAWLRHSIWFVARFLLPLSQFYNEGSIKPSQRLSLNQSREPEYWLHRAQTDVDVDRMRKQLWTIISEHAGTSLRESGLCWKADFSNRAKLPLWGQMKEDTAWRRANETQTMLIKV